MVNRPYSFSFIFHDHYSLAQRKETYQRYADRFYVKLYQIKEGFSFPELIFKAFYDESDFLLASGIVVGNQLCDAPITNSDSFMKAEGFYNKL
jgi:hypothetical protein